MTAEREEPQLQVRDGGGGRHWRVSDVGFFFPANIQQLKLQQGKGAFLGGGGVRGKLLGKGAFKNYADY